MKKPFGKREKAKSGVIDQGQIGKEAVDLGNHSREQDDTIIVKQSWLGVTYRQWLYHLPGKSI